MNFFQAKALYFFKNKLFYDLKFSLKLQYSEREEIYKFQNDKFIKLINHANKNAPYYSAIIKDIKDINDLSKYLF